MCLKFQILFKTKFYMTGTCCQECKQKQKRYQILKADLEFQLKRMWQDLAEEKVMLQMNFQRQLKKSSEKYQKEKQQRQDQNKNWINKYDKMVFGYESYVNQKQSKHELDLSNLKQTLLSKYETQLLESTALFKQKTKFMNQNHDEELNSLSQKQKLELINIKGINDQTINSLKDCHIQKINQITFDHEERLKKLRKQIESVKNEKQIFAKQTQKKQTILYQELYQRNKEIISLKEQLNTTIKDFQEEIKSKNKQIQNLKDNNQKQLQKIKKENLLEKSSIVQDFKRRMQHLLLKKLEDCVNFQQNVKQIQDKRQTQLKMYQTYLQEFKQLIHERPSRNEDIQQITILKELLINKQKQIQKLAEQAKNYRLQLEYKDETFNRIFKINSNPLNIEKIGKKKDFKLSRGSAICRQNIKYNPIITMQAINTRLYETRKDKSIQVKSNRMF